MTVSDSYGIYSVVYGQVGAVTLRFGRDAIYRVFYLSRLLFYVVPLIYFGEYSCLLAVNRRLFEHLPKNQHFRMLYYGAQRQDEVLQHIVQIKTPVTLKRMPG